MTYIKVKIGDPIEKALRVLKKKLDKEGIIKAAKNHRFYDKPSIKKRAKSKAAKKREKRAKIAARRKY
ncbi:MAG: 30S ribosomal protein S21 [Chlamydiae bacterium SM23_39]|nr:MAG: 30S ribosomal protein S21 [Chlamydiae bacterium SM23_39]